MNTKSTTARLYCTDPPSDSGKNKDEKTEEKEKKIKKDRHFPVRESVEKYSTVKMYSSTNIPCRKI